MARRSTKTQPEQLREFLEKYTVAVLRKLAKLVTAHLPNRKADLIAVIEAELMNPERLKQLWTSLDELQRAAVAEVVHGPSLAFDADAFRAKYGDNPNWGEFSRWGGLETPSKLGLFLHRDGGGPARLPRDLQERLKAFVPPPRDIETQTIDEPPKTISQVWREFDRATRTYKEYTEEMPIVRCETEQIAQHDLQAVLRLIEAGKIRVSAKTKRVTAAGAKAISDVLQNGDFYSPDDPFDAYGTDPGPIRAFAWPLIVQSAGLANLSGTKLQLTPAGKKALTGPPHQAIRRAWKRWLKTTILDEFNRIDTIKGQTGRGKRYMTAVAKRRAAIVEALTASPTQQWIAFDEFSRFMRAAGHTFEVSRDLWTLYIEHADYGSLGYAGFGDWHIIQGRYILAFLFEYAATMGLIDIAYIHPAEAPRDFGNLWGVDDYDCLSRYDGLLYLRINNLGAWCLGLADQYTPSPLPEEQLIRVLPNLEIVAVAPLAPADSLFLEQFARQTAERVWKIETEQVLAAIEAGQTAANITTFLKAKTGHALPNTVTIFFNEIAERVAQLVDLGPARLIEAQDAALAHLIVNDSQLRAHCMLAGERHIVVPADSEKAFRRALRKLGYTLPFS